MALDQLQQLVASWRDEAGYLRHRHLEDEALFLESCADELDDAIREWWHEPLSLFEAAGECSWSKDTIAKQIGNALPQAGERYKPKVRRCDLHAVVHRGENPPSNTGDSGVAERHLEAVE